MAGFFTRLFRRKKASYIPDQDSRAEESPGRSASKKEVKKNDSKKETKSKKVTSPKNMVEEPEHDDGAMKQSEAFPFSPSSNTNQKLGSGTPKSSTDPFTPLQNKEFAVTRKVSNSQISSPHSIPTQVIAKTPYTSSHGPVDLDDTDFEESDHDENRDRSSFRNSGLSFQQLHQFNIQQQQPQPKQNLYVMDEMRLSSKVDDTKENSESSHSEFNLSTDAEDEEYNTLKRRVAEFQLGIVPVNHQNTSGMSSPSIYTTDDERAIFPALQHDDDSFLDHSMKNSIPGEAGQVQVVTSSAPKAAFDDIRAWGLSPSTGSSSKENGFSPSFSNNNKKNNPTTKKKQKSPAVQKEFANFADFDSQGFDVAFDDPFFSSPSPSIQTPSSAMSQPSPRGKESTEKIHGKHQTSHRVGSSSQSLTNQETKLSDLLAQARIVGKSRRDLKSPSSVNSAPVMTAQYLRKHHDLGNRSKSTVEKPTSVSDIIQSLAETDVALLGETVSRHRSNRSVGSRDSGANASVRSARERVRERRRKEREGLTMSANRNSISKAPKPGAKDSEGGDPSENWLFEEIAGALGPRGFAADMESLGNRSTRSKGSGGNKSSKSQRSQRSRRHKSSSNESLDSRGSKNSRYSHKSTRSYLSQMSEQSRSVANDLLRLEMQLAMVGSEENVNDIIQHRGGASMGGSVGGNSRTSRTSRNSTTRRAAAVSKRTKISVVAPPGKLGIILANKADSKGTVVSGVRTSSVLAEKISPGDRIVAIDGEDVSRMTVSEITTIMARKSEFERNLTVLTTPKHMVRSNEDLPTDNVVPVDDRFASLSR